MMMMRGRRRAIATSRLASGVIANRFGCEKLMRTTQACVIRKSLIGWCHVFTVDLHGFGLHDRLEDESP